MMWWRRLRALKRGQAPPPHLFLLLIPSILLEIALGGCSFESESFARYWENRYRPRVPGLDLALLPALTLNANSIQLKLFGGVHGVSTSPCLSPSLYRHHPTVPCSTVSRSPM
jgi:hypothetical protein